MVEETLVAAGRALNHTKNIPEFSKGTSTLLVLPEKIQAGEFGVGVSFDSKNPAVSEAAARVVLGASPCFPLMYMGAVACQPPGCWEAQKVVIVVCTGGAALHSSACSCLSLVL